jgi:hypothetical protein
MRMRDWDWNFLVQFALALFFCIVFGALAAMTIAWLIVYTLAYLFLGRW